MKGLSAGIFYLFFSLLALTLAHFFHISLLRISPRWPPVSGIGGTVFSGIGLGAGVLLASHFLDRFPMFSRLNATIARSLPAFDFGDVLILSVASAIGEELLFRGALLPLIGIHASSLLFGFLHYGGKRPFLLWGIMGWIMGYLLSGLFLLTGSLLSPVLAHFTINYFNLLHLIRTYPSSPEETA